MLDTVMLNNTVKLEEVKKSSRDISDATRFMLWGRAAGRCQFSGCNKPLWKHPLTQEPVNIGQAAHIYSFSPDGPRGNEGIDDVDLNFFENLLLTCHACHKTIDGHQDAGGRYSVELLQKWKADHEARIERVTEIDPANQSHVVLYGKGIGDVDAPLRYDLAANALFPLRFPAEKPPIELGTGTSDWTERDERFWEIENTELERKYERLLRNRLSSGEISHLSVFALAPMPLLIRLGTLLTDIHEVDVYQLHRKPKGWHWPETNQQIDLQVEKPKSFDGPPALVIALSAPISDARIQQTLGPSTSIWRLTIPEPFQDCIRSKADLDYFYLTARRLLNEIHSAQGDAAPLSIFPAAPVSSMVELGRCRQPKADPNWIIYDHVNDRDGFVEAIRIGNFKETKS